MYAKDVMTTSVISIRENATVREACVLLLRHGITGMPVVNERNQIVGVITEFGLIESLFNPQILNNPVANFMTRDVLTVDENEPLSHVATLFLLHRVRRLPVVRNDDMDGHVVGVISRRDLIRVVIDTNEVGAGPSPDSDAQPTATI